MEDNNFKETEQISTNNEVKRSSAPRNLEKGRRPSIVLSVILLLAGAIIAIAIIMLFFGDKIITSKKIDDITQVTVQENNNQIVSNENTNGTSVEEGKVKEVRVLNLNPEGDFITLLYNKLLIENSVHVPQVYKDTKVMYENLDVNDRMLHVLQDIKGETVSSLWLEGKLTNNTDISVTQFNYKDVEKLYKSYYGSDKEISKTTIRTVAYMYEWVESDYKFYGHTFPGGGGSPYKYYRKIVNCESNAECTEVYIYDKYVSTMDVNLTVEDLKNRVDSEGVHYKHTFKLDDSGNYYWYSSEKTN